MLYSKILYFLLTVTEIVHAVQRKVLIPDGFT